MPELSRFIGIVIRRFSEVGAQHHVPHFHAWYHDEVGIIGVDPVEIIAGSLPRRQLRLVEAWAELHQDELLADWETLQKGKVPRPIEPLSLHDEQDGSLDYGVSRSSRPGHGLQHLHIGTESSRTNEGQVWQSTMALSGGSPRSVLP